MLFGQRRPGGTSSDEPAFGIVDGDVLAWVVTEPVVEGCGPNDAEHAEEHEGPAPANPANQIGRHDWCDRTADEHGGVDEPLSRATGFQREPAGEDASSIGQRTSLAGPK